jgi:GNAT superfamily N-acetyltransferase
VVPPREELASVEYPELVTRLLRRCRLADPTGGLWEAADLQWWWRRPRSSDGCGQLFWLDERGEPAAAVVLTDWGRVWSCDAIVAPDTAEPAFTEVWRRALDRIAELGLTKVEISARDDAPALREALAASGFAPTVDAATTTWLEAARRPAIAPLPSGYRLLSRAETADLPHHMMRRNGERVAERLAECSIYDPELDLLVQAPDGEVAAYVLFWPDPVTRVGLVEPVRTEAGHQRRGLARHLLTVGLDRLAERGCTRLKVGFDNANPAARWLYLGLGFTPESTTRTYGRAGVG